LSAKRTKEKKAPLPPVLGGEEVLVDPDAKLLLWKPKEEGETRTGKLLGKSMLPFGPVLNLDTAEGLVQIPVSVVLKKINWDKYEGRNVFFQYTGTRKRYRMYLVKALAE